MAIISSFDTTTLEGLVNTTEITVNALKAPLSEFSQSEHLKRVDNANKAMAALRAYITSII